jgi:alpha-N-arabinofuranosidase
MKYSNPIIPGFYPDPSVCRVGQDYYLVNSSFEYFPGVPIFHSRDLVHWQQIGHCLTRESQLPLRGTKCSDGIYAPTIRHHQGRFYMATTNMIPGVGFRNFFVHTDDPAGEWSDPVWVEQGGIDPSLWFDDDGKVYWTGNGTLWAPTRGIYQSEIDITTGKLLSETKFVWPGTGGGYPEAPHLFKRGDYYYLTIAEGGTAECHMVTVARAKHPFGPFESCPHNPVLTHRSLMNPIQATGHADFFEDHQGNWWAVFLGIRYAEFGFHNLGRETNLAPVEWTADGWPVVHGGQKVTLEMEVARDLPSHLWPALASLDHFDQARLALSWIFLRNPNPDDYSLNERPGSLRLRCSPVTLNELDSPAFLARRQQHFECRVSTVVDFVPQAETEEAGIAVVMDVDHHVEFVVTLRNGQRVALVRRRVGSLVAESLSAPLPAGQHELVLETDRKEYRFSVANPGLEPTVIGRHELRYLSTQVAGGYVGVVLGLYASSNGKPSSNQAYFDWLNYQA